MDRVCRACRGTSGEVVLDLGMQPACDLFPLAYDPGPDPRYPLQMWLCLTCGLAQLADDAQASEERKGIESKAMAAQARDAVERMRAAGFLEVGNQVAEYGSPHGDSWMELLGNAGAVPSWSGGPADVVLDCFGLMHAADQSAALDDRIGRLASGGVLLVQYRSLAAIVRCNQWNELRHGHYAYHSASALARLLEGRGFGLLKAWDFDLLGGTTMVAAKRVTELADRVSPSVQAALEMDAQVGVCVSSSLRKLQFAADIRARGIREWLVAQRSAGRTVLGYAAASRAVPLLACAGLNRSLLRAVIDASPAKQGRRMPGTDIPIIAPFSVASYRPDFVLVFVPGLLQEAREVCKPVDPSGAVWIDVESIGVPA